MMTRLRMVWCVGLVMAAAAVPLRAQESDEGPGDLCDKCMLIDAGMADWCDTHNKGSVLGFPMTSKKLYDALAPIEHSPQDLMACPGCRNAADGKTKCEKCGKLLIGRREYKSPMAHKLAKGREVQHEAAFQCDGCKKAWAENGSCSSCNLHYAGKRMFQDQAEQKAALAAYETIKKATESKCEGCAVAMVTDGKCDKCNKTFKEGAEG